MSSVINIRVNKPQISSQRNKKIVTYEIETVINEKQHIVVNKRYNEFAQEYRLWVKIAEKKDRSLIPPLPKKDPFKQKFDESKIEIRRGQFEEILRKCSHIPQIVGSEYFQHFIGVKGHLSKSVILAHFREIQEDILPKITMNDLKKSFTEGTVSPVLREKIMGHHKVKTLETQRKAQDIVLKEKDELFRKILGDMEIELADLRVESKNDKEKAIKSDEKVSELNKCCEELNKKNEDLMKNVNNGKLEIGNLEEKVKSLMENESKIKNELDERIKESGKMIKEYDEKIVEIEKKLSVECDKNDKIQKENSKIQNELNERIAENDRKDNKLKEIEKKIEEIKVESSEKEKKSEEKIEKMKKEFLEEKKKLEDKYSDLQKENEKLKKEITEIQEK